jgi:outer membrane lipoprotein-sorting protein
MAQSSDQNPDTGRRFSWRLGEGWRLPQLCARSSFFKRLTQYRDSLNRALLSPAPATSPTPMLLTRLASMFQFSASPTQAMAGRSLGRAAGFLPLLLWGPNANPLDLLAKTFENHRKTPVEMFQIKRPFFESEEITLRVAVDSGRRMRIDVLRPLMHQGVVSLDDGKTLKTFYPDKARTVVQVSPLKRRMDSDARLKLIKSNYLLEADPGPRVAGRTTFQITLTPKNREVPGQAILVDEEKMLPLRILADDEEGVQKRALLDTFFVRFGRPKSSIKFSVPEGKGIDVVKSWGPVFIEDAKQEAKSLGFIPHIPKKLPFGFSVLAQALQGNPSKPLLTVTVSDGILSANLFMWSRAVHGKGNPISRDPLLERDGVFFAVYGDAPPHLARTLLSYFLIEKKLTNSDPAGTGNRAQPLTR